MNKIYASGEKVEVGDIIQVIQVEWLEKFGLSVLGIVEDTDNEYGCLTIMWIDDGSKMELCWAEECRLIKRNAKTLLTWL